MIFIGMGLWAFGTFQSVLMAQSPEFINCKKKCFFYKPLNIPDSVSSTVYLTDIQGYYKDEAPQYWENIKDRVT